MRESWSSRPSACGANAPTSIEPGQNHGAAGTIAESYDYDGDGLRQTKTSDGILRNFAYDLSGGLPLVINDGPTAYITGPGGLPIEQITETGTVRYFHHDQLGSTTALTNESGSTVASYDYDAYGNLVGVPPAVENPFGFAGQYTDWPGPWGAVDSL